MDVQAVEENEIVYKTLLNNKLTDSKPIQPLATNSVLIAAFFTRKVATEGCSQ